MPIYKSLPPDPPPVPFIISSVLSAPTIETLQYDVRTLTAYINTLVLYLASYQPTVEVP